MPDLLLELFSEEIPARMQPRAAEDLKRLVTTALVERGLTYAHAAAFATPRRLTLALTGLPAGTPDTVEERKGPRVDAPEKALAGFLRSTGLEREQLEAREDKKGQVWFARIRREGRAADEVIAEAIPEVVRSFPWPKSMRWGAGTLRWVRPLRSILCILTDEAGARVVPFEVDGLASGDTTEGHRFMAPGRVSVTSFEHYEQTLAERHVVLDPAARADRILNEARTQAFAQGLELVEDRALLTEVAGLVEWPVVLMGRIEERFLDLPPEVLQTSMKEHQKFFSVRNPKTGRIEAFITVANIEAPDGGRAILSGNARVLAARLSDAKFFWENDLRVAKGKDKGKGMEAMAKPLANVTFHSKLGTQAERIERIAALARQIAPHVGADPQDAERAARIAKADLASEMVYEFPELQGTMGRYYAEVAGEKPEVARAAEEHYKPLGPSDEVPDEPVSIAVALADKIDLLAGFWAIDEKPTGSKDPFALRRAALGVIRTILEKSTRIELQPTFDVAARIHRDQAIAEHIRHYSSAVSFWTQGAQFTRLWPTEDELTDPPRMDLARQFLLEQVGSGVALHLADIEHDEEYGVWLTGGTVTLNQKPEHPRFPMDDLLAFLADRLKVHLRGEGIRHDVIAACFELGGQDDLVLLVHRVRALQDFLDTEDGGHLLTGYARAANILRQAGGAPEGAPDPALYQQTEERALGNALAKAEPEIAAALEAEDFARAMSLMAALRQPIDAFFDEVLVNAEDEALRANRLRLLDRIRSVMAQVAVWEAIEG